MKKPQIDKKSAKKKPVYEVKKVKVSKDEKNNGPIDRGMINR